jgi:hypothetical protein
MLVGSKPTKCLYNLPIRRKKEKKSGGKGGGGKLFRYPRSGKYHIQVLVKLGNQNPQTTIDYH